MNYTRHNHGQNGEYEVIEQAENQNDGKGLIKKKKLVRFIRIIGPISKLSALYAAAATTGATGGASIVGSSIGAVGSGAGSAAAPAGAVSVAGFSRGATGAGSSILGGCSSTLAGAATSVLALGLKKSPTREERRRASLAFFSSSFFSLWSSWAGSPEASAGAVSVSFTASAGVSWPWQAPQWPRWKSQRQPQGPAPRREEPRFHPSFSPS